MSTRVTAGLGLVLSILALVARTPAPAQPPIDGAAGAGRLDLEAVPRPVLDDFETAVATQLRSRREAVESLAAQGPAGAQTQEAYAVLCLLYLRYDLMDSAEPCLGQLRALRPADFRWPYFQSLLYLRDADLERARSSIEAALELRPDDVPSLLRAGDLYLLSREPELAAAAYGAVLERRPQSSAARFGLGRIAAERGETAAAITHFEAALPGQPEGSVVHYHLGLAYRAAGDLDRARAELERNRQQAITFPDPLVQWLDSLSVSREVIFYRGVEARRQGRPRDAIDAFRRVLEQEPDEAEAHYNLARALIELAELGEAELHLRQAVAIRPGFFDAHVNLAILLGRKGQAEEAARHLGRAVEIDPENLPTRVLWARLLAERGEGARALAELESVLRLDPATPEARLALGALQAERGELEAAARTLTRALEERAGDDRELGAAHLRLALIGRSPANRAETLRHLRAALELDPEANQARALLAEELAAGGQFGEAAAELSRLVELAPRDRVAHRGRGMTLILAGEYAAARRALEASIGALPDDAVLANLLARLLATCPDPEIRDGRRAVALAEAVVEAHTTLDHAETLAMALAEAGRFEDAILVQERVLAEEEETTGTPSSRRRERLALYQQHQPVRAPWRQ